MPCPTRRRTCRGAVSHQPQIYGLRSRALSQAWRQFYANTLVRNTTSNTKVVAPCVELTRYTEWEVPPPPCRTNATLPNLNHTGLHAPAACLQHACSQSAPRCRLLALASHLALDRRSIHFFSALEPSLAIFLQLEVIRDDSEPDPENVFRAIDDNAQKFRSESS